MNRTIECICGYIITTAEYAWKWTCPDCGRTWTFTSNGKLSQMTGPTQTAPEETTHDNL